MNRAFSISLMGGLFTPIGDEPIVLTGYAQMPGIADRAFVALSPPPLAPGFDLVFEQLTLGTDLLLERAPLKCAVRASTARAVSLTIFVRPLAVLAGHLVRACLTATPRVRRSTAVSLNLTVLATDP